MAVTTVLSYKVNENDLKAWLEANIGFANGVPLFSYSVRLHDMTLERRQ